MVLDAARFPEVTNLGSMLGFALALEEAGEALAGGQPGEAAARLAKAHGKRRRMLEEARREKLNEVTLEPINGFAGGRYLVAAEESSPAVLKEFEEKAVAFYRAAALAAKNISPEIARLFERFAKDGEAFANGIA